MYKMVFKRVFDVVVSLLLLCLLFPIFLIAALAIKLDSKGPVFFLQERIGQKGIKFNVIKFRSMYPDDEREERAFDPGALSRVTKVGGIFRKTKIDELPQLANILTGDMSFVGPRPEVPKYRNFFEGKYRDVLSVRPGITDKASIKYRNEENILREAKDPEEIYRTTILPDKLDMGLEYVKKGLSFSRDMDIIAETIKAVVLH